MNIRISLVIAAVLLAAVPPAQAAQNLSRHATVAPNAKVDVSNVAGRIDVTAWDRNEVELTAMLESDKDQLEFEASEQQVSIEVIKPHHDDRGSSDAVLTLKIPRGAKLSAETVSADVTVAGVKGEQRLNAVSGDVRTEAYDEPVTLETVSGDGTVVGTGGKAAVSISSISGLAEARGIRGGFDGEVVSGKLKAEIAAAEAISLDSVSGDIEARVELTPDSRVEMESVSGAIAFTIKPPVNAEFDVESFSGQIDSCFSAKARDRSRHGSGSELNFTQGSGGASVHIESMSGDIKVCDR